MTILDVLNFRDVYPSLANVKLPFQTVYKLSKISTTLEKEFEFYQKKFNEILDSYAQKKDDGSFEMLEDNSSIRIQPDKIDECANKIQELYQVIITEPADLLEATELESINLTLSEMNKLMPFIK